MRTNAGIVEDTTVQMYSFWFLTLNAPSLEVRKRSRVFGFERLAIRTCLLMKDDVTTRGARGWQKRLHSINTLVGLLDRHVPWKFLRKLRAGKPRTL